MYIAKDVQMRFHLKLTKKDESGIERPDSLVRTFDMGSKKYVSVNLASYATIEIKDGEWDMSKSVMITDTNIAHVILAFEQIITNIRIQDTFYIDNGETKVNQDVVQERIVRVFGPNQKVLMVLEPIAVYVHHEDLVYEGCRIYLNTTKNFFDIPYDMLYSVLHKLKKIDFHIYAHNLMQSYLVKDKLEKRDDLQGNVTTNRFRQQHALFQEAPKGGVSSTLKTEPKDLINLA